MIEQLKQILEQVERVNNKPVVNLVIKPYPNSSDWQSIWSVQILTEKQDVTKLCSEILHKMYNQTKNCILFYSDLKDKNEIGTEIVNRLSLKIFKNKYLLHVVVKD